MFACIDAQIDSVQKEFGLESSPDVTCLKSNKSDAIIFVFYLLTGMINSHENLPKMNLFVPSRVLFDHIMFCIPYCKTNYVRSEPVNSEPVRRCHSCLISGF